MNLRRIHHLPSPCIPIQFFCIHLTHKAPVSIKQHCAALPCPQYAGHRKYRNATRMQICRTTTPFPLRSLSSLIHYIYDYDVAQLVNYRCHHSNCTLPFGLHLPTSRTLRGKPTLQAVGVAQPTPLQPPTHAHKLPLLSTLPTYGAHYVAGTLLNCARTRLRAVQLSC